MVSGRTVIHAVVGAVVGVVLSFLPFSTVIGGAVAGFLEGPDGRDGAIVGALAGAITFVPIAGMALLMLGVVGFGMGVAAVPIEGFAIALLGIAMISMLVLLYTVGLSLLGGYLGAYLAREYPEKRASTRRTIGMGRYEPTDGHGRGPPSNRRGPQGAGSLDDTRDHDPYAESDSDLARSNGADRPSGDRTREPLEEDRLDPTRWHDEHDSDADESTLESDSDTDRTRDRERDRNA